MSVYEHSGNEVRLGTLRHCPFCGEILRLGVYCSDTGPVTNGVHFDEPVAVALCFNCAAAAGFIKIGGEHTREEAIEGAVKFWNMREGEEGYEQER